MEIKNIFNLGDEVIAKTDKKSRKMIVTGLLITENGITYQVSYFDNIRYFYGYELKGYVEREIVSGKGAFKKLTVQYLKGLEFEQYVRLLNANDKKTVNDIMQMLVRAEEYEMAEVTKRYLCRLRE